MKTQLLDITNAENQLLIEELQAYEEEQKDRSTYQKVVKAAIAQWYKDLREGNIKFSSVNDLEQLLQLEKKLREEEL
ncbi:hypothetical protein ACIGHG_23590 [Bacillus sp. NPDC077411]|uniref:hypothetical protein n=1 Tax=Bacillus sp. NPDC077411 TaxID=3363947 RepID=UPI0037C7F806